MHRSGFGGYAGLTASKSFLDDSNLFAPAADDQVALCNLELGGVYQQAVSRDLDVATHLGVTLPTADEDEGFVVNLLSATGRMGDLVLALPNTMWLRAGVTPTFHKNGFFARADLGVDLALDSDTDLEGGMTDVGPFGHLDVGVGYAQARFAASAELATTADLGEVDEHEGRFVHTATLSGGYRAGTVVPHLALAPPSTTTRAARRSS